MTVFRAIILGIIQGIAEFLPISSSAHLIIFPYLFGWEESGLAFDIALHFGTMMAVLVLFFKDWWNLFVGAIKDVCPGCGRHENEGIEMEKISCLDCYGSCSSFTK